MLSEFAHWHFGHISQTFHIRIRQQEGLDFSIYQLIKCIRASKRGSYNVREIVVDKKIV